MRKLVLTTLMSLDGAVDQPGNYFLPKPAGGPPAFDDDMAENEARITDAQDTVLLGRGMYEEWAAYWPTSQEEPFASFINNVQKLVVTSTPLTPLWRNAMAVQGPIEALVADLKARPGRDIGVHGSITLAQSLLAAGLVDELQLVVGPGFGYSGRRLFERAADVQRLELIKASPTPSGSLLLEYRLPSTAAS